MQDALANAFEAAFPSPVSWRQVPARNFHLTLAFLGAVPLGRLAQVEEVASRCARIPDSHGLPIEVALDGMEHWRKPQVLVATSSRTPVTAVALAETLQRSLLEGGFSPDLKPFRIHATVARKVLRITHEVHMDPVHWRFDSLHLIESRPGSTYSTVKKWVLDKRD